jgi:DNA-binding CsgD family transcriptional regulator
LRVADVPGPDYSACLRIAGASDLLERDAELAGLLSVAQRARDGHGGLVVVEGAAGTGKSALTSAMSARASEAGLRVLTARGSELERDFAYGAIRHLFEKVLQSASQAERSALLAGAAGPAAWAVVPQPGDDAASAGPEAGFAALHGIYWLASNLAQRGPVLLVVDDLHWADPASVRALAYVARRIADMPAALVVALRPDEPDAPTELLDELLAEPDALRLVLRPLGPDSVATLVRGSIPDAGDAVCAACFAASAGNPFYLRELLRAVPAGDVPDVAEAIHAASVPAVGDRILRRVARLGDPAVGLARAMAVLDDGGRLAHAAALAGIDERAAADLAARLRRIEILANEDPFAFVHPLVRRSLYDGLSVVERDAAHAAAADLFMAEGDAPEAAAAHLASVRPERSSEAAAALAEAAREAFARAAPESAVLWLRRALQEQAPEPPRVVLLHELGVAEVHARDPAAVTHLQEAFALAKESSLRARIGRDLSQLLFAIGHWAAAVAAVSDALAALGDRDPELRLELEMFRATMRAQDPRLVAEFDRDRARLGALAGTSSWGSRALAALLLTVQAARHENLAEVRAVLDRERYDGQPLDEQAAVNWATTLIWAFAIVDEDDRARELVDALTDRAREVGAPAGALMLGGFRGWLDARRGDLGPAEAEIRPGIELSLQAGSPLNTAAFFWFMTDAMLERPALDDLGDVLLSFPLDPEFAPTWGGAMLLEARGYLRLARGDRAGAVEDLRANAATNRALRRSPGQSHWRSALALALSRDDREEALALADEEVSLTGAIGLPRQHGIALRAAGLLRAGDDGLDRLQESVALIARTPARLEHARSLVELGAALRRRGRRVDARERLAEGMDLAHRCGAERLVARAGEELRATGARPRRVARTGIEALTASELRAARLAAEGRTNAEAAQELFVSLKTVETHLSNAYAKLGLTGPGARRRLAAAFEVALLAGETFKILP